MAYGQIGSALSGAIAATTTGVLWLLRYPEAAPGDYEIRRIHVQATTLVAYTTPITAGRGLRLVIGRPDKAGVLPTGGATFSMAHKRDGDTETLGIGRMATTGALTVTNFTLGVNPRQRMALAHLGAAGDNYDEVWRWGDDEPEPIILRPGWFVAVATEQALDAGGSLQLQIDVDARET